jgi:membrane associated rhomboid family serine protease
MSDNVMDVSGKADNGQQASILPIITYTLIALNIIIYLADRNFGLFGSGVVYSDLTMRPKEVIDALRLAPNRFPLITPFTAMFLHGGLVHLVSNLFFLWVFGPPVEKAVGPYRYIFGYIGWGIFASAVQIYAQPQNIPTLGASGAIGGVLGCYLLLFPSHELELIFFGIWELHTRAWIFLSGWFLYQILMPHEGVANWAHVGGFFAGMVTVLIAGGRTALLKGREQIFDD